MHGDAAVPFRGALSTSCCCCCCCSARKQAEAMAIKVGGKESPNKGLELKSIHCIGNPDAAEKSHGPAKLHNARVKHKTFEELQTVLPTQTNREPVWLSL